MKAGRRPCGRRRAPSIEVNQSPLLTGSQGSPYPKKHVSNWPPSKDWLDLQMVVLNDLDLDLINI